MAPFPGRADEPDAEFSSAYRTYAHDLRRFAVYLSGNAAVADDLVAEAFVRAWTVRDRIEFSTVRGYLFAIVRNLFLQQRRRDKRGQPLDDGLIDASPRPDTRTSDSDELRIVLAALALLPEIDRAAVLMRADDGLPYEDIAAALGISVTSAKVKVHRARLKLAAVLPTGRGLERNGRRKP
jgi:RNA polymerase sigma-70 factor (ECF subfamily)